MLFIYWWCSYLIFDCTLPQTILVVHIQAVMLLLFENAKTEFERRKIHRMKLLIML
jgi:hypothetical protein